MPKLARKMIEVCTFHRMLVLIVALVGLCVIILIVENHLTPTTQHPKSYTGHNNGKLAINISKTKCPNEEEYTVKSDCAPCSEFEKKSGHLEACSLTGFKEVIVCSTSGEITLACDKVPWLEEKKFWIFEGCMIGLGVLSAMTVIFQQRNIERKMLDRIQKQISAGI